VLTGKIAGDIINLNSEGCTMSLLEKVVIRVGLYQWERRSPASIILALSQKFTRRI